MNINHSNQSKTTLLTLPALLYSALRRFRLTALYITGAILLCSAWIVSSTPSPVVTSGASSSKSTEETLQRLPLEIQDQGGTPTMQYPEPQSNSIKNESNTSVESNAEGTTVTVNGETESIQPNQTFQKTYTSTTDGTSTTVDVTVRNQSSGSDTSSPSRRGQSLDVRLHSSSSSTETDRSRPNVD